MNSTKRTAGAAILLIPIAAALAALLVIPAMRVSAHAAYDHSTPEADSVVATAPVQVDVFFKEEMTRANGLPTLTVATDAGDIVSQAAVLDDTDRKHMSVALNSGLKDGRYTVIWHNVSADDGDEATGVFFFYVGTGPSPLASGSATTGASSTATPAVSIPAVTPAPNAGSSSSDVPVWGLIAGIVGGVVVGGGGGLLFGRRSGS